MVLLAFKQTENEGLVGAKGKPKGFQLRQKKRKFSLVGNHRELGPNLMVWREWRQWETN